MAQKRKLTDEQKKLFDMSGAKNDWVVGLVFIGIFLTIVGINIFCRYRDNRKLENMEYTQGVVTSRESYEKWIGSRRHVSELIIVEYSPNDSNTKLYFHDSDGPYELFDKGDILDVYYVKDNPEKVYIAKVDWLTGRNVRGDIDYNIALILSVFPLFIGVFFFVEELTVRKNIRRGKFKLKKSDGLYPDENLHELARMSNYKRSWNGALVGLSLLYVFFMFMGSSIIYHSFTSIESDKISALIAGIFILLLAHGAAVGVFFIARFVLDKKRNFIKGFMADDATLVYKDRQKAADVLWKHVKHFMEAETMWSRYKYDYSRLWLEKYGDELERFKKNEEDSI